MPMDERVRKELSTEKPSKFHEALLSKCKGLVDASRRRMADKYPTWDYHDSIYRGYRKMDKQDQKTAEKGEPTKMTVPITKSQVDTFIAFNFAALFQREYFFELIAREAKAERTTRIGEVMLQRDLDYSNHYLLAYQFLLDIGRFGIGIYKDTWKEEKQFVEQVQESNGPLSWLGAMFKSTPKTVKVQKLKFQGNKIVNISPYRFFPDPRFPITRFQEGEFVASEDEYSYISLRQMQADGEVAGVEFIENMNRDTASQERKLSRLPNVGYQDATSTDGRRLCTSNGNAVLTEVQLKLIPSETMLEDGKTAMGPENYPVKYVVWYVNDNRIIKCEPLSFLHDQFTYSVAQLTPDQHQFLSDGLAGSIDQLQEVVTWFINSHITSVRRVIQNQLLVDPSGVNMEDVNERRPVIRIKEGVGRFGLDKFIHQIQLQDVTGNHMQDAEAVHKLVQIVTGVNDNALGQFHTGRRSAEEARRVGSGVASRMKMNTMLIFASAYIPLGTRMLSNLQQGLSMEVYVKVFGLPDDPMQQIEKTQDYATFVKITKADLVGEFDFAIFDGTLPSEKFMVAETLQEFIQLLLGNLQLVTYLGYDLKSLVDELLRLRGIRNPERFKVSPQLLMQRLMQAQLMQQQTAGVSNAGEQNGVGQAGSDPSAGGTEGAGQQ